MQRNIHPIWKLLALYVLANALLLGWRLAHRPGNGNLVLHFLDVGQGDACVLQTPSGKVIVIDTGGVGQTEGDDEGRRVVAPFLRQAGINHIDALLLSHPHADHIGGATTLLQEFPTSQILDNGGPHLVPLVRQYLQAAQYRHCAYNAARRGQSLDCGDGVTIDVLAPTEAETLGTTNNASLVLRVTYGRTIFLFTGDAEKEEEADLLASGLPLGCDVLKTGHHGSHTSTTPAFLDAAHPSVAVISVGAHNVFGHPNLDVLERLHDHRVQIFRTDQNGAIRVTSDGILVQAHPYHSLPSP